MKAEKTTKVSEKVKGWDRNEKVMQDLYGGPHEKIKQFGNVLKGTKTLIEERAKLKIVQDAHLVAEKHEEKA